MATDTAKPSRAAALEMWLEAVNARCVRTFEDSAHRIQIFNAHGRQIIVQTFKPLSRQGEGFEVFVPASSANNVAATLEAARDFIVSGHVAPSAMACCEELIRGDGTADGQQRAIDHARAALGLS